jgi:hypothetical protein
MPGSLGWQAPDVISRSLSLVVAVLVTIGAAKPSPTERAMASYEAAHPGVRRIGGNVTRPILIVQEGPLFPPPVILDRAEPDLQPYVLRSLRTWRYKPATLKGKPVPVFLILTTNIHVQ